MESTWRSRLNGQEKRQEEGMISKVNLKTLPMVRWTSNSPFYGPIGFYVILVRCVVVLLPRRSRYTFFLFLALIARRAEPMNEGRDVRVRTYREKP